MLTLILKEIKLLFNDTFSIILTIIIHTDKIYIFNFVKCNISITLLGFVISMSNTNVEEKHMEISAIQQKHFLRSYNQ
jgi:hypothetical protein